MIKNGNCQILEVVIKLKKINFLEDLGLNILLINKIFKN